MVKKDQKLKEIWMREAELITSTSEKAVAWLELKHKVKITAGAFRNKIKLLHDDDTNILFEWCRNAESEQVNVINEFELLKERCHEVYADSNSDFDTKLRAIKLAKEIIPFITASKEAIPHIIQEVIKNFGESQKNKSKKRTKEERSVSTTVS